MTDLRGPMPESTPRRDTRRKGRDIGQTNRARSGGGAGGRYRYERPGEKTFQRLYNAVLTHAFGDTRRYPVGHSDGGRDVIRQDDGRLVIYQVKWTSKPQQNPVT